MTHSRVAQLTNASSLAAVYLHSYGIKLYYLLESIDLTTATIIEMSRGWPWWSSSKQDPQLGANKTVLLNTTVPDTRIPLAAAAVDMPLNLPVLLAEIHLYFVDMSLDVSSIFWSQSEGWGQGSFNFLFLPSPSLPCRAISTFFLPIYSRNYGNILAPIVQIPIRTFSDQ
jgi:hypothetical protein